MNRETADLWVFGYGSLMWKPGFEYEEAAKAALPGYVRRFCLDSITYRGTPEFPGLVLALDEEPGGRCEGLAYRIAPARADEVRDYLRARELVTYSYLERLLPVETACGRRVEALCYVMDRSHAQYHGGLSLEEQARVIATARGPAGSNREYLENTVAHLAALDIEDVMMSRLNRLVSGFSEPVGG